MSEPQRTIEARLAQLEAVERVGIDRTDRMIERVDRLEARMDARFTGLEGRISGLEARMDARLDAIQEEQRRLGRMLAELLTRIPPPDQQ